jgi:hypothetical protein
MKRSPRSVTTKVDENIKRYVKNIRYHELQIHTALVNMQPGSIEFDRMQAIIASRRARVARLRDKLRREELRMLELTNA